MTSLPRRRYRRTKTLLPVWLIALIVILACRTWSTINSSPPPLRPTSGMLATVERAVDGDTLRLTSGEYVRLLGVDTPETKHPDLPVQPFGIEACEFTRKYTEGKQVRLEFDRERRDRYRRILAYVYVGDLLLNEELIRAGFGRALLQYPYRQSMKNRFRDAEEEARTAQRGIWNPVKQAE
jgi:micrococcal nuclease